MAKIAIFIGAHISTAPRPQKEADVLSALGHEVIVRGCWFDPVCIEKDLELLRTKEWSFKPYLRFDGQHKMKRVSVRLESRIARECFARVSLATPGLFGYGARALHRAAIEEKSDLTILHSEAGLWAGAKLVRSGHKLGVDFEDWFSEDLPPEARLSRPVKELRRFEALLARECEYALTTSHCLAERLSLEYEASAPAVVYNSFPPVSTDVPLAKKRDRLHTDIPSLHWFSQTIGRGRGLEVLMAALPHITSRCEIHLRGAYGTGVQKWLEALIPERWRERVFVHPLVTTGELPIRIAEHDIGLALETDTIPSRDLTVTNKLFQYMSGGLAIIATQTQGQCEVMSDWTLPEQMIPCNDPIALAAAAENLIRSKQLRKQAGAAARNAIEEKFSWEAQASVIRERCTKALQS